MNAVDRLPPSTDALAAALAGLAAVSGSYAVTGPTPVFVASPVERFVSRTAPIELIVFAISTFGDLGQRLNYLFAVALVVAAVGVLARLSLAVGRAVGYRVVAPLATALGTWGLAVAVAGDPATALGAAVPAGIVVLAAVAGPAAVARATGRPDPLSSKRRTALAAVGAAAGIAGVGYLSGERLAPDATSDEAAGLSGPNVDEAAVEAALAGASAQELDEPEIGPLVSEQFYEVDINAVDPDLSADAWELSVTGAVEESFTLDYDDLLEMPAENRFVTLRCVSDDLDGTKMDNALWTGVNVDRVLERAGPTSDCGCVRLHAADDYFQVFPVEAFEDSLLAYGMNGNLLPRGHGYPVRTLVPGHWGEINVKWLTEIEFLDEEAEGYWEQRGWHGTGPVVPVAKLSTVEDRDDGTRLLGGRAYGGTRGVEAVEVSTDGGDTWSEARLSEPLAGVAVPGDQPLRADDAWRQWAYTYEPSGDPHTAVVRMRDRDGEVQPGEERDPFPRGASGWVSREF